MKVYYVGNRYDGCYYVRCYLPLLHNGWDGDLTSMSGTRKDPNTSGRAALDADVVVFQRPDDPARVQTIPLLQQLGKKVVFDNDDTYLPNSGVPTTMYWKKGDEILKRMNENIYNALAQSDLVTTTTEFLAEEYRKINPNVVVLPNMIDPDDWPRPKRNTTSKVRVGLIGSTLSNGDYTLIEPLLHELNTRDDVQLCILGLPRADLTMQRSIYKKEIDFWNSFDIEWTPFVPQAEYADAVNDMKLDILLIPRDDSYFNRCKSNIKFLEASMLEIPVIAQGFTDGLSPYQGKNDAAHMRVCITLEDWRNAVNELVANKALRRQMGKSAKAYVRKYYNIHKTAKLWKETYQRMFS